MLIGALPLGIVAGIALGAVVWMHTYSVLKRTGTEDYLPTVLAAAVLLELAPIGAGLIVAARTGASLGAELGAMKLGEQLDALELLGLPPMRVLVGPRVLACIVALAALAHIHRGAGAPERLRGGESGRQHQLAAASRRRRSRSFTRKT